MRFKNTYFQFRQFRIEQEHVAMKVSTEACILGAYAWCEHSVEHALDIGAGSGLLSLMLAQRYPNMHIDAVEIEPNAFLQAQTNVKESIFRNRITVFHQSIQEFAEQKRTYDLIISNPPFFKDSLLSPNDRQNMAYHQPTLTSDDLIKSIKKLLAKNGIFWLILPEFEMQLFNKKAREQCLFLQQELGIYHSTSHHLLRKINAFGWETLSTPHKTEKLFVREPEGQYSEDFKKLMADFYL